MIQFNKAQQDCLDAIDGVYVTIAGPGSGKTTVLIQRYLRMLEKGIPTDQILNLTFTAAAASEMVRRVGMFDSEKIFRTFHSFAIEILKKEREHLPFELGETVIPVAAEDYKLLFDLVRQFPVINNFRTLKEKISVWKVSNIEPDQAIEEARHRGVEYFYALAYEEYERKCREQGWLDFDGCIKETVKLLRTNEEVRQRHKKRYIAVDEFQDTDSCQLELLQLIFEKNLFCVGDENQNLYSWRGSQTDNLTNFSKAFPGAKTLYLGQNYRSSGSLLEFFKEILPIDNGLASHMITENDTGVEPVITEYQDDSEEANAVLAKITDLANTAIIARTNRQLFIYQRLCATRGIKYKTLGRKDFFEQNEVRKLLKLAKESGDTRQASVVLSDLIQRHNLIQLYRNTGDPLESDPAENLNSIVKMAANKGTVPEFLHHLRKITHARRSVKGLTLSTGHQAKGREFDHVFVIGVCQGKLPHTKGEISEERRIWFVSCSRAAKTLNISFYGNRSEFLNDYIDKIVVHSGLEQEI